MDINYLKEFVAVAQTGSFTAAADLLNTPKSTVSKRVQDLEAALNVRLIERTTRQLRLTSEGAILLPRAERILADATEAERLLSTSSTATEGHLRIRMPSLFAQAFAGALVANCRREYPNITLEIVLLDRPVDLMSEGFDGGIYIGALADSQQAARTIAVARTIPVCAPQVLPPLSIPIDPSQLSTLPALTLNRATDARWVFSNDVQTRQVTLNSTVAINSLTVLREAAIAGAGVANLPEFLVKADIESGALVRLLPDWSGDEVPISFVYPSPHSVTARLGCFIDVLVKQFPDRVLPEPSLS